MTAPLNPKVKSDPLLYWRTAAFVLAIFIFIAGGAYVIDRGRQTKESIYKGCIVLSNVIVEQQSGAPVYQTLVAEILRNADATGHPEVRLKVNQQKKAISNINLPACKKLADDPSSIKPTQLVPTGLTKQSG